MPRMPLLRGLRNQRISGIDRGSSALPLCSFPLTEAEPNLFSTVRPSLGFTGGPADVFGGAFVYLPKISRARPTSTSEVEKGPAFLVAKPLIVEHEVANRGRNLCTLPLALCTSRFVAMVWSHRCADCPDGIRSRTEIMLCHMGHCHCMTSRASRFRSGTGRLPGRGVCSKGRDASLSHGDLTARPSARLLNRMTRTFIPWMRFLEEVQDVLGASRSPGRKKTVIGICKGATATFGDEPWVSATLLVHERHIHQVRS